MHHRNQQDETLVMLTLAGEETAYEALVTRYQKAVIAAAASVTKNQFMAEDAAQDAFVTAWMKLNTLQEPQKFGSWVCRIAKNCALNMVGRYRSFLPLDIVDNVNAFADADSNPAELYALSEEREEVNKSIEALPEKVKQIIHLHYFEGLSIVEIADRLRISEGTVKWQLHDGRKRIRKELCAMNEKWNDTLVQRVMKKVEELKLWQVKNDKSGFDAVYRDVLREVEDLPESGDKYHALADVLMRGWWWLPGDKNDALFARIKEAAERGKNDEVMEFIVSREDSQVTGEARIEFIRDKQIPRLEQAGFVRAAAREWFWLGCAYLKKGKTEEGNAAMKRVQELLRPFDVYYALVPDAKTLNTLFLEKYKPKDEWRFLLFADAIELRYMDGAPRYWTHQRTGEGCLNSIDRESPYLFRNASRCDGVFFAEGHKVGESIVGSDGATLTLASEHACVDTPCGRFEDCLLWVVRYDDEYDGISTYQIYYKEGVGIVRHEHKIDGMTETWVLSSYRIAGGKGLLPLSAGNTWEYVSDSYASKVLAASLRFAVSYADTERVIVTSFAELERLRYDKTSWVDAIQEIRNEYHTYGNNSKIRDVYDAIERAERLAKTPMEKAHTRAACSVARRILDTDPTFNPNCTATGHWNFFHKDIIRQKNGFVLRDFNYRWSFEWKNTGGFGRAGDVVLYNDIYGILQDATKCLWSDEWRVGASPLVEYTLWGSKHIKTQIVCEDGGCITTKAGRFENCLKLTLTIGGMDGGHSYRGGKKVYYFANGIGIVRTENIYGDGGAGAAIYELTSYEGIGKGYMPFADGLQRRYDAIDLTDGFEASAEYTYLADDEGQIVVFSNRTGIRQTPPPITQYGAIQDEIIEDQLWDAGKREESRLRHDVTNFKLLMHFLGRPNRNWAAPQKAVAWGKHHIRTVEFLAEGGEIPRAWLGRYWYAHFSTACALFGCRTEETREEGYRYLEKAFKLYPQWAAIPDGELLEVGNELIWGGIKLVKGEGIIVLPDGTREYLDYDYLLAPEVSGMYYGMTAPRGWEWFNSVRNEDRFKEYIERAKKLMEGK